MRDPPQAAGAIFIAPQRRGNRWPASVLRAGSAKANATVVEKTCRPRDLQSLSESPDNFFRAGVFEGGGGEESVRGLPWV